VIFGIVLRRDGYPHSQADICKKYQIPNSSPKAWEGVLNHCLSALKAAMAKRKIYKYDDLPLPEPPYKVRNHYIVEAPVDQLA
jgi:hypothetical protein